MFGKKIQIKLTVDEQDAVASAIYTQMEVLAKAKDSEAKRDMKLLKKVLKRLGR